MLRMMRFGLGVGLLTILLVSVLAPVALGTSQGQGKGASGGDNQTAVGITVEPPSSGGGAWIQATKVADLDLTVSPDNPRATAVVELEVHVDQAVAQISIYATITNKNHMKIKWYNLLENGHFLINGNPGTAAGKGPEWEFGVVWQSTDSPVMPGDYVIQIPIELDLTAGGKVDPRIIPAGSTGGKAVIVWTLVIGDM
mgnify:CR=1 FL=1